MALLPPIPYRSPMLDPAGLVTRNWQQFLEALLVRVGGIGDITPNDELEIGLISDTANENMALLTRLEREINAVQDDSVISRASLADGVKDLAELHAEIEGKQCGQEMRAGKLQRLAQCERKTETVHQPEAEGDQPATLPATAHNIL